MDITDLKCLAEVSVPNEEIQVLRCCGEGVRTIGIGLKACAVVPAGASCGVSAGDSTVGWLCFDWLAPSPHWRPPFSTGPTRSLRPPQKPPPRGLHPPPPTFLP